MALKMSIRRMENEQVGHKYENRNDHSQDADGARFLFASITVLFTSYRSPS